MATGRRVHRLRLRGPDQAAVGRGARLIEDAVRTASIPTPAGRVIVVRRLALGSIGPGATAARVSRMVESALERPGLVWCHGLEGRAAGADVVWFSDAVEAHVALARRLLSGRAAEEWFWPLAIPAWRASTRPGEEIALLRESLGALPEAPAALACFDAALEGFDEPVDSRPRSRDAEAAREAREAREASNGPLRSALHEEERRHLAPTESPEQHTPAPVPAAAPEPHDHATAGAAAAEDPRPDDLGAARADAGSPGEAVAEAAAFTKPALSAKLETAPTAGDSPPPGPRHSALDRAAPGDGAAAESGARLARLFGAPSLRGEEERSSAGGLLFLLNALAALGYQEWLANHPDWVHRRIATRVMIEVLNRLGVPDSDPVRHLLDAPAGDCRSPSVFRAPAGWSPQLWRGRGAVMYRRRGGLELQLDPAGRLLLAARALDASAERSNLDRHVVDAWSIAVRRWLRRAAGIGLASLVRRPARLTLTSTHVDLVFDLDRSDLRVRRAGLDLDPGWVPWFGRVVSFHYLPGEGR